MTESENEQAQPPLRYPRVHTLYESLWAFRNASTRLEEDLRDSRRFFSGTTPPKDLDRWLPLDDNTETELPPLDDLSTDTVERVEQIYERRARPWVERVVRYRQLRDEWRAALEGVMSSLLLARSELDEGEKGLDRPSYQVERAIESLRRRVGSEHDTRFPWSFTEESVAEFGDRWRDLDRLREQMKPKARDRHQEPAPQSPPARAPAPASTEPPWRDHLGLVRRAFEDDRRRHPLLHHFIIVEADGHHPQSHAPMVDGTSVVRDGTRVKISQLRIAGTCSEAGGGRRGYRYYGGFLGDSDDIGANTAAIASFQRSAAAAWRCLPAAVRATLRTDPYVQAAAEREDSAAWILGLYTLAWSGPAGGLLRADRTVYFKRGTMNLEVPLRGRPGVEFGPDVPQEVRAMVLAASDPGNIEEALDAAPFLDPEERAAVGNPLNRFAAFLEPDIYMAAEIAIGMLLERDRAGAAEAASQSPAVSVRSTASGDPPQPGESDRQGSAAGKEERQSREATEGPLLPASWYAVATQSALYPDLLRVARREKRIRGKKHSGRWRYEFESVVEAYPQYETVLRAALKAHQSEANRSEAKE